MITYRRLSSHCMCLLLVMMVLSLVAGRPAPSSAASTSATTTATPPKVIGYFIEWGIYRAYLVKNLVTSGSAPLLTHINYAFSNVAPAAGSTQVTCQLGDPWADYQKTWTAAESVNGVAVPGGTLRGNFQQFKVLKAQYPNLKVMISLGGWSWSNNFSAITDANGFSFKVQLQWLNSTNGTVGAPVLVKTYTATTGTITPGTPSRGPGSPRPAVPPKLKCG